MTRFALWGVIFVLLSFVSALGLSGSYSYSSDAVAYLQQLESVNAHLTVTFTDVAGGYRVDLTEVDASAAGTGRMGDAQLQQLTAHPVLVLRNAATQTGWHLKMHPADVAAPEVANFKRAVLAAFPLDAPSPAELAASPATGAVTAPANGWRNDATAHWWLADAASPAHFAAVLTTPAAAVAEDVSASSETTSRFSITSDHLAFVDFDSSVNTRLSALGTAAADRPDRVRLVRAVDTATAYAGNALHVTIGQPMRHESTHTFEWVSHSADTDSVVVANVGAAAPATGSYQGCTWSDNTELVRDGEKADFGGHSTGALTRLPAERDAAIRARLLGRRPAPWARYVVAPLRQDFVPGANMHHDESEVIDALASTCLDDIDAGVNADFERAPVDPATGRKQARHHPDDLCFRGVAEVLIESATAAGSHFATEEIAAGRGVVVPEVGADQADVLVFDAALEQALERSAGSKTRAMFLQLAASYARTAAQQRKLIGLTGEDVSAGLTATDRRAVWTGIFGRPGFEPEVFPALAAAAVAAHRTTDANAVTAVASPVGAHDDAAFTTMPLAALSRHASISARQADSLVRAAAHGAMRAGRIQGTAADEELRAAAGLTASPLAGSAALIRTAAAHSAAADAAFDAILGEYKALTPAVTAVHDSEDLLLADAVDETRARLITALVETQTVRGARLAVAAITGRDVATTLTTAGLPADDMLPAAGGFTLLERMHAATASEALLIAAPAVGQRMPALFTEMRAAPAGTYTDEALATVESLALAAARFPSGAIGAAADDVHAALIDVLGDESAPAALRAAAIGAYTSLPPQLTEAAAAALRPTAARFAAAVADDPDAASAAGALSADERMLAERMGGFRDELRTFAFHFGHEPKNWGLNWGSKAGFFIGFNIENSLDAELRLSGASSDINVNDWARATLHVWGTNFDIISFIAEFRAHVGYRSVMPDIYNAMSSAAHVLEPAIKAAEDLARRVWDVISVLEDVWKELMAYIDEVQQLADFLHDNVQRLVDLRLKIKDIFDSWYRARDLEQMLLQHIESSDMYQKISDAIRPVGKSIGDFVDRAEPELEKAMHVIESGDTSWIKNDVVNGIIEFMEKLTTGVYAQDIEDAQAMADRALHYFSDRSVRDALEPDVRKRVMEEIGYLVDVLDRLRDAAPGGESGRTSFDVAYEELVTAPRATIAQLRKAAAALSASASSSPAKPVAGSLETGAHPLLAAGDGIVIDVSAPVSQFVDVVSELIGTAGSALDSGAVVTAARALGEVPDFVEHGTKYVHTAADYLNAAADQIGSAVDLARDYTVDHIEIVSKGVTHTMELFDQYADYLADGLVDVQATIDAFEKILTLDWLVHQEEETADTLRGTVLNAQWVTTKLEQLLLDAVHLKDTADLVEPLANIIDKVLTDLAETLHVDDILEALESIAGNDILAEGGVLDRLISAAIHVADGALSSGAHLREAHRAALVADAEASVKAAAAAAGTSLTPAELASAVAEREAEADAVVAALEVSANSAIRDLKDTSALAQPSIEFASKTVANARSQTDEIHNLSNSSDLIDKAAHELAEKLVLKLDEAVSKELVKLATTVVDHAAPAVNELVKDVEDMTQSVGKAVVRALSIERLRDLMHDLEASVRGFRADGDEFLQKFVARLSEISAKATEAAKHAHDIDAWVAYVATSVDYIADCETFIEPLRQVEIVRQTTRVNLNTASASLASLPIATSPIPLADVLGSPEIVAARRILEDLANQMEASATDLQAVFESVARVPEVVDRIKNLIALFSKLEDDVHEADRLAQAVAFTSTTTTAAVDIDIDVDDILGDIDAELFRRIMDLSEDLASRVDDLIASAMSPAVRALSHGLQEVAQVADSLAQSPVAQAYLKTKEALMKLYNEVLIPLHDKTFPLLHTVADACQDLDSILPDLLQAVEDALHLAGPLKRYDELIDEVGGSILALMDHGIDEIEHFFERADKFIKEVHDFMVRFEPDGVVMKALQHVVDLALPSVSPPSNLPDPASVPYCGAGICPRLAPMVSSGYRDARMAIDSAYFFESIMPTNTDKKHNIHTSAVLPGLADGFVPTATTYVRVPHNQAINGRTTVLLVAYNHISDTQRTPQPNILVALDPNSLAVLRVVRLDLKSVDGTSPMMAADLRGIVATNGPGAMFYASFRTRSGEARMGSLPMSKLAAALAGSSSTLLDQARPAGPVAVALDHRAFQYGAGGLHFTAADSVSGSSFMRGRVTFVNWAGTEAAPLQGPATPGLVDKLCLKLGADDEVCRKHSAAQEEGWRKFADHGIAYTQRASAGAHAARRALLANTESADDEAVAAAAAAGAPTMYVFEEGAFAGPSAGSPVFSANVPVGTRVVAGVRQGSLDAFGLLVCSADVGMRCRLAFYSEQKIRDERNAGPKSAIDALPLPAGAVGFAFDSGALPGDMYRGHMVFASAALPVAEAWRATGHPLDDSVYRVAIPILETESPRATANRACFKWMGHTYFDRPLVSIMAASESGHVLKLSVGGRIYERAEDAAPSTPFTDVESGAVVTPGAIRLVATGVADPTSVGAPNIDPIVIMDKDITFFACTVQMSFGVITVGVHIDVGVHIGAYYGFYTDLMSLVGAYVQPHVYAFLNLKGYVQVFVIRAGIEVRAHFCDVLVTPQARMDVLSSPLGVCITADGTFVPLEVRVYGFVEFHVCFHCHCHRWRCHCGFNWCGHRSVFLWGDRFGERAMHLFDHCWGDSRLASQFPSITPVDSDWGAYDDSWPDWMPSADDHVPPDWDCAVPHDFQTQAAAFAQAQAKQAPATSQAALTLVPPAYVIRESSASNVVGALDGPTVGADVAPARVTVSWSDMGMPVASNTRPESPVAYYLVSVGSSPGASDLIDHFNATLSTTGTFTLPASVADGTPVYTRVEGHSHAGNLRTIDLPARRALRAAPRPASVSVVSGSAVDPANGMLVTRGTEPIVLRMAYSTTESNVREARYRLVSADDGTALTSWRAVPAGGVFSVTPHVDAPSSKTTTAAGADKDTRRAWHHGERIHVELLTGSKSGAAGQYVAATLLVDFGRPAHGSLHPAAPWTRISTQVPLKWSGSTNQAGASISSRRFCLSSVKPDVNFPNSTGARCDLVRWTESNTPAASGDFVLHVPAGLPHGKPIWLSMRTETLVHSVTYTHSAEPIVYEAMMPRKVFLTAVDPNRDLPKLSPESRYVEGDEYTSVGNKIVTAVRYQPSVDGAPLTSVELAVFRDRKQTGMVCPWHTVTNGAYDTQGCTLTPGIHLYVTARVTSEAGNVVVEAATRPIVFIDAAPTTTYAHVSPGLLDYNPNLPYSTFGNRVFARVSGLSAIGCPLKSVDVRLTDADSSDVLAEQTIMYVDDGALALHQLSLKDGAKVRVAARGTNYASLTSNWVEMDPEVSILVDLRDPTPRSGYVGVAEPGLVHPDLFQWWSDSVRVAWTTFTPGTTPVDFYQICVGTHPGRCNVAPWTVVRTADVQTDDGTLAYVFHGLELAQNSTVSATVRAVAVSGRTADLPHTPETSITIDATAPRVSNFKLATGSGIHHEAAGALWLTSQDSVSLDWDVSTAGESGVRAYRWSIGTQPGTNDVQDSDWIDLDWNRKAPVGARRYPAATHVSIPATSVRELLHTASHDVDTTVFYITLEAVSGAGYEIRTAVGSPIRVDDTPPTAGTLYFTGPELQFAADVYEQADPASVCFSIYDFHETRSAIEYYDAELVDVAADHKVLANVRIRNSLSARYMGMGGCFRGLELMGGHHYALRARATSYAGLTGADGHSRHSLLVDVTPPELPPSTPENPAVTHPTVDVPAEGGHPAVQASTDQLHLAWPEFKEPESTLTRYYVCWSTTDYPTGTAFDSVDCDVVAWVSVAAQYQTLDRYGLDLESYALEHTPVYGHVAAANSVGLVSAVSTSAPLAIIYGRPEVHDLALTVSRVKDDVAQRRLAADVVDSADLYADDDAEVASAHNALRREGAVSVSWTLEDHSETDLISNMISIGTSPFQDDVIEAQKLPLGARSFSFNFADHPVACRSALYATVRVMNGIHYTDVAFSNAGVVLCDPPVPSRRVALSRCLTAPVGLECCTPSPAGLAVEWDPFVEKLTRVEKQLIGACSPGPSTGPRDPRADEFALPEEAAAENSACALGKADLAPFREVDVVAAHAEIERIADTLPNGAEFRAIVRAVNTGGLASWTYSGPARLVTDVPTTGSVHNTLNWLSTDFQRGATALYASWTDTRAGLPEGSAPSFTGPIAYYNVTFGPASYGCGPAPGADAAAAQANPETSEWFVVDAATSGRYQASAGGLKLKDGTEYCSTVCAVTCAGKSVCTKSAPTTPDSAVAPTGELAFVAADGKTEIALTDDNETLRMRAANFTDGVAPLRRCTALVGSVLGGSDIFAGPVATTDVAAGLVAITPAAPLEDGVYYGLVECVSATDVIVSATTMGLKVATTVPDAGWLDWSYDFASAPTDGAPQPLRVHLIAVGAHDYRVGIEVAEWAITRSDDPCLEEGKDPALCAAPSLVPWTPLAEGGIHDFPKWSAVLGDVAGESVVDQEFVAVLRVKNAVGLAASSVSQARKVQRAQAGAVFFRLPSAGNYHYTDDDMAVAVHFTPFTYYQNPIDTVTASLVFNGTLLDVKVLSLDIFAEEADEYSYLVDDMRFGDLEELQIRITVCFAAVEGVPSGCLDSTTERPLLISLHGPQVTAVDAPDFSRPEHVQIRAAARPGSAPISSFEVDVGSAPGHNDIVDSMRLLPGAAADQAVAALPGSPVFRGVHPAGSPPARRLAAAGFADDAGLPVEHVFNFAAHKAYSPGSAVYVTVRAFDVLGRAASTSTSAISDDDRSVAFRSPTVLSNALPFPAGVQVYGRVGQGVDADGKMYFRFAPAVDRAAGAAARNAAPADTDIADDGIKYTVCLGLHANHCAGPSVQLTDLRPDIEYDLVDKLNLADVVADGSRYFVVVASQNTLGLTNVASSSALVHSETPPTAGTVAITPEEDSTTGAAIQHSRHRIRFSWAGIADRAAGISAMRACVEAFPAFDGSVPSADGPASCDVAGWMDISNVTTPAGVSAISGLKLRPESSYVIRLRAFNGAMVSRDYVSTPVLVTAAQPRIATVDVHSETDFVMICRGNACTPTPLHSAEVALTAGLVTRKAAATRTGVDYAWTFEMPIPTRQATVALLVTAPIAYAVATLLLTAPLESLTLARRRHPVATSALFVALVLTMHGATFFGGLGAPTTMLDIQVVCAIAMFGCVGMRVSRDVRLTKRLHGGKKSGKAYDALPDATGIGAHSETEAQGSWSASTTASDAEVEAEEPRSTLLADDETAIVSGTGERAASENDRLTPDTKVLKRIYVSGRSVDRMGPWRFAAAVLLVAGIAPAILAFHAVPPPVPHPVPANVVYHSMRQPLTLSWALTTPAVPGVRRPSDPTEFQVAVGHAIGATDVLPWTSAGLKTAHTIENLAAAQPGDTLYASVRARDQTGRWGDAAQSTRIVVADDVPVLPGAAPVFFAVPAAAATGAPTGGLFDGMTGVAGARVARDELVRVGWAAPLVRVAPLDTIEVCIGTRPYSCDVVPTTNVEGASVSPADIAAGAPLVTTADLPLPQSDALLPDGTVVYGTATLRSGKNVRQYVTPGATVVARAPAAGVVYNTRRHEHATWQISADTLESSWSFDGENVAGVLVTFGFADPAPGMPPCVGLARTAVAGSAAPFITASGLALAGSRHRYFCSRVCASTLLVEPRGFDSSTETCVNSRPIRIAPEEVFGPGAVRFPVGGFQKSLAQFDLAWTGFHSESLPLDSFRVSLGSAPFADDVSPLRRVTAGHDHLRIAATDAVKPGTHIYATVCAVAGATGQHRCAASRPVVADNRMVKIPETEAKFTLDHVATAAAIARMAAARAGAGDRHVAGAARVGVYDVTASAQIVPFYPNDDAVLAGVVDENDLARLTADPSLAAVLLSRVDTRTDDEDDDTNDHAELSLTVELETGRRYSVAFVVRSALGSYALGASKPLALWAAPPTPGAFDLPLAVTHGGADAAIVALDARDTRVRIPVTSWVSPESPVASFEVCSRLEELAAGVDEKDAEVCVTAPVVAGSVFVETSVPMPPGLTAGHSASLAVRATSAAGLTSPDATAQLLMETAPRFVTHTVAGAVPTAEGASVVVNAAPTYGVDSKVDVSMTPIANVTTAWAYFDAEGVALPESAAVTAAAVTATSTITTLAGSVGTATAHASVSSRDPTLAFTVAAAAHPTGRAAATAHTALDLPMRLDVQAAGDDSVDGGVALRDVSYGFCLLSVDPADCVPSHISAAQIAGKAAFAGDVVVERLADFPEAAVHGGEPFRVVMSVHDSLGRVTVQVSEQTFNLHITAPLAVNVALGVTGATALADSDHTLPALPMTVAHADLNSYQTLPGSPEPVALAVSADAVAAPGVEVTVSGFGDLRYPIVAQVITVTTVDTLETELWPALDRAAQRALSADVDADLLEAGFAYLVDESDASTGELDATAPRSASVVLPTGQTAMATPVVCVSAVNVAGGVAHPVCALVHVFTGSADIFFALAGADSAWTDPSGLDIVARITANDPLELWAAETTFGFPSGCSDELVAALRCEKPVVDDAGDAVSCPRLSEARCEGDRVVFFSRRRASTTIGDGVTVRETFDLAAAAALYAAVVRPVRENLVDIAAWGSAVPSAAAPLPQKPLPTPAEAEIVAPYSFGPPAVHGRVALFPGSATEDGPAYGTDVVDDTSLFLLRADAGFEVRACLLPLDFELETTEDGATVLPAECEAAGATLLLEPGNAPVAGLDLIFSNPLTGEEKARRRTTFLIEEQAADGSTSVIGPVDIARRYTTPQWFGVTVPSAEVFADVEPADGFAFYRSLRMAVQVFDTAGALSKLSLMRVLRAQTEAGERGSASLLTTLLNGPDGPTEAGVTAPNAHFFTEISVEANKNGVAAVTSAWSDFCLNGAAPAVSYEVAVYKVPAAMAQNTETPLDERAWTELPAEFSAASEKRTVPAGAVTADVWPVSEDGPTVESADYRESFAALELEAGAFYAVCMTATDALDLTRAGCTAARRAAHTTKPALDAAAVVPGVVFAMPPAPFVNIEEEPIDPEDPNSELHQVVRLAFANFPGEECVAYSAAIASLADDQSEPSDSELAAPTGSAWTQPALVDAADNEDTVLSYRIYSLPALDIVPGRRYAGAVTCWLRSGVPGGRVLSAPFTAGVSSVIIDNELNFGDSAEFGYVSVRPAFTEAVEAAAAVRTLADIDADADAEAVVSVEMAPARALVEMDGTLEVVHAGHVSVVHPDNAAAAAAFKGVVEPEAVFTERGARIDCSTRLVIEAYDRRAADGAPIRSFNPEWEPPTDDVSGESSCLIYRAAPSPAQAAQLRGGAVAVPAVFANGAWRAASDLGSFRMLRTLSDDVTGDSSDVGSTRFAFCGGYGSFSVPDAVAVCIVPTADFKLASVGFDARVGTATCATAPQTSVAVSHAAGVGAAEMAIIDDNELADVPGGRRVSIRVNATATHMPGYQVSRVVHADLVPLADDELAGYARAADAGQLNVLHAKPFRTPALALPTKPVLRNYCGLEMTVDDTPVVTVAKGGAFVARVRISQWTVRVPALGQTGVVTVRETVRSAAFYYTALAGGLVAAVLVAAGIAGGLIISRRAKQHGAFPNDEVESEVIEE